MARFRHSASIPNASGRRRPIRGSSTRINGSNPRCRSRSPLRQAMRFGFPSTPTGRRISAGKLEPSTWPSMAQRPASDLPATLDTAAPSKVRRHHTRRPPLATGRISVTLVSFDRGTRKAVLKLTNWRDPAFAPYLVANSNVDLLNDIFVTKGQSSFKWYETVKKLLIAVGNPPIAVADNNAATAMGASPPSPGSDPVTPLARILWAADAVHPTSVVAPAHSETHSTSSARSPKGGWPCQRPLKQKEKRPQSGPLDGFGV